jgi:hypothetical protein
VNTRRTRPNPRSSPRNQHTSIGRRGTPGILELDRFSSLDLQRWKRLSKDLDRLHSLLYFGFVEQRNVLRTELLEALQAPAFPPFKFQGWVRILPYRYCLSPLSARGSLNGTGGRFNAGHDIPSHVVAPWPALYLAEDFDTAFREKYGNARNDARGALKPEELALQKPESITSVRLHGQISRVFDLTDAAKLKPFCDVLARCKMPREVADVLRRLKIKRKEITTIKTPAQLQAAVMAHHWRQWPVQFEVPAHGQVLASLLIAAGYEAILYRSSKSDKRCLAVFPCNIGSNDTWIELAPDYPEQVDHARLDLDTAPNLSGVAIRVDQSPT